MAAERLQQSLSAYWAELARATDPSQGRSLAIGREIDQRLVEKILAEHGQLRPDQALVLTVALADVDENYGEFEGYAGYVHDSPVEFARKLKEAILDGIVKVENGDLINKTPEKVEIVIPPNKYPGEDLGVNTSVSRGARLSGEVREYLDRIGTRTSFLVVKPSGMTWSNGFAFHPSTIKDIRIQPLVETKGVVPQAFVRIVSEKK